MKPAVFTPFLREPRLVSQVRALLESTGRAHVPDVLMSAAARALHDACASVDWTLVAGGAQGIYNVSRTDAEALGPEGMQALVSVIHARAREGFQYMFDTCRVSDHVDAGRPTPAALASFYRGLNEPDNIEWLRALTGDARIAYADAQVTRYRAGHFLSAHTDAAEGKNRLYAYVLNLTPRWSIDWGGLLEFQHPTAKSLRHTHRAGTR